MDVVCGNCRTEYELDDAHVGEAGVSVKCTQCGYLFRVGPTAPAAPAKRRAAGTPALGSPVGWMLRNFSGEVYRLSDLATLQAWIIDRKVTRFDEISRTGQSWKRLEEIPELVPFFDRVDKTVRAEVSETVDEEPPAPSGYRMRAATAPSTSTPVGRRSISDGIPPTSADLSLSEDTSLVLRRRSGSRWLWGSVTAVIGLGLVAGAYRWFPRDRSRLFRGDYVAACAALERDTELGWQEAERLFAAAQGLEQASGEERQRAVAGLAALRAARAQAALDEAEWFERHDKMALADEKRQLAETQATQARGFAEQALAANSSGSEANVAMADALRLLRTSSSGVEEYLRRARVAMPGNPAIGYVEGALRLSQGKVFLARELLAEAARKYEQATKRPMVRAEFRLAVLEIREANFGAARDHLGRVVSEEAGHNRAVALQAELETRHSPAEGSGGAVASVRADSVAVSPSEVPVAESVLSVPHPRPEDGPANYAALVREGDRLSEQGRSAQASRLYRKALGARAGGAEALTGLGYCEMDAGNSTGAIHYFQQALSGGSSFGDAMIGAAEAYRASGDVQNALRYYQRYLAEHPGGPKSRMADHNARELERKLPQAPKEIPSAVVETAPATP